MNENSSTEIPQTLAAGTFPNLVSPFRSAWTCLVLGPRTQRTTRLDCLLRIRKPALQAKCHPECLSTFGCYLLRTDRRPREVVGLHAAKTHERWMRRGRFAIGRSKWLAWDFRGRQASAVAISASASFNRALAASCVRFAFCCVALAAVSCFSASSCLPSHSASISSSVAFASFCSSGPLGGMRKHLH